MLHDIGKLILAVNFTADYQAVIQQGSAGDEPLWQQEQAAFGASHAEIGAYLMGLWGLEPALLAAIAFHHTPDQSQVGEFGPVAAVHLANFFEHETGPGNSGCHENYLKTIGVDRQIDAWRQSCTELQGEQQ
jgi:HD-like signal output (HDOD) protein